MYFWTINSSRYVRTTLTFPRCVRLFSSCASLDVSLPHHHHSTAPAFINALITILYLLYASFTDIHWFSIYCWVFFRFFLGGFIAVVSFPFLSLGFVVFYVLPLDDLGESGFLLHTNRMHSYMHRAFFFCCVCMHM